MAEKLTSEEMLDDLMSEPVARLAREHPKMTISDVAEAFFRLTDTNKELRARMEQIEFIILSVENRCMAADGPVTPTLQEMTEDEMREIWKLTQGL